MSNAGGATLSSPLTVNGVLLFTSPGQPGTFLFVPAAPIPQDAGGGRPAVSAVRMPNGVLLQAGALFALTAQDTAALTKYVAQLAPPPRLKPAPISIVKASLMLTGSDGQAREIARSTSSLYPPFSAIFSTTLDAANGAIAIAAINGRAGVLSIAYWFTLPDALARQRRDLIGPQSRSADVASWFPGGSGGAHIQISG